MNKINKINIANGIPSKQDVRTQQAAAVNENARKSEYAQRFANQTQEKSAPTKLNEGQQAIARLVYPEDLGIYYIGFEFQEYTRANLKQSPKSQIKSHIALPIPNTLVDALHQRYEELQTGLLGNALDDLTGGNGGIGAAQLAALAAAGWAGTKLADRYSLIQGSGGALKTIGQIASQKAGLAFNPYLAIFYVSPSFKVHEFSWRLTPRTVDESMTVREIIRTFHEKMSPGLEYTDIFFTYPDVCIPKIFAGDKENEYMYNFKPCVIENCIVNYAPNGVPAFFAGTKAPVEIELRLTLKELDLWLKKDYEEEAR